MSTEVTPTIGKAETLLKELFWDNSVKAAMAYFHVDFWPLNAIITMVSDKIFEGVRTAFDLPIIRFRNEALKNDFNRAAVTLSILEQTFGLNSVEYKRAKENAKIALSKHVRFGVAA